MEPIRRWRRKVAATCFLGSLFRRPSLRIDDAALKGAATKSSPPPSYHTDSEAPPFRRREENGSARREIRVNAKRAFLCWPQEVCQPFHRAPIRFRGRRVPFMVIEIADI